MHVYVLFKYKKPTKYFILSKNSTRIFGLKISYLKKRIITYEKDKKKVCKFLKFIDFL